MSSRSVTFIDASNTPGFFTWPLTQYSFGPPFFSGPTEAYHSAPFATMMGTLQSVSTLLTAVETLCNVPIIVAKGAEWYASVGHIAERLDVVDRRRLVVEAD